MGGGHPKHEELYKRVAAFGRLRTTGPEGGTLLHCLLSRQANSSLREERSHSVG